MSAEYVMPQKFRLSIHRKNEFQKKRGMTVDIVSIPPSEVAHQSSTSFPLSIFLMHTDISVWGISVATV